MCVWGGTLCTVWVGADGGLEAVDLEPEQSFCIAILAVQIYPVHLRLRLVEMSTMLLFAFSPTESRLVADGHMLIPSH